VRTAEEKITFKLFPADLTQPRRF